MPSPEEILTLVELQVENIKRLVAVRIRPDGRPLLAIGGANGQGKTSLLDAIEMLFAGKRELPEAPVHRGAEQGQIIGVLSNGLKISKTIGQNGKVTLKVTAGDGTPISSPQKLLDDLVGELTFDPMAFLRLKPKEQAEALAELLHLDLRSLDGEFEELYAKRRLVNRDLDKAKGHLNSMPFNEGVPPVETSVLTMATKLQEAERHNRSNNDRRREVETAQRWIAVQRQKIVDLQKALEQAQAELATAIPQVAQLEKEVEALVDEDTDLLRHEMQQVEEVNALVRQNLLRAEAVREVNALQGQSDKLTEQLDGIQREKVRRIQAAKMPVEGLAIDGDGVTFNGLPLASCSGAEKIRISTAMAFSQHPSLRIALVRDGSLLDDKSMEIMARIAAEHGGQVWIERVGDGKEVAVLIDDGEVRDDRMVQA